MWPFDVGGTLGGSLGGIEAVWLALYLLTFALHAVFVSYVAAGAGYALVAALRRSASPIAARTRDWLPFMLGAGITAGIGPLLFLQLLHQRRFYTANLLLGPRWGAVVPALIVGFYALYLAKASERWRRIALGVATACFGFVAWSWTEIHQLMAADGEWQAMYGAGARFHLELAVLPRLALWAGAMLALFATVAAWQVEPVDPAAPEQPGGGSGAQPAPAAPKQPSGSELAVGRVAERRRLAALALVGWGVAVGAAVAAGGFDDAHGWTYALIAGSLVAVIGWIMVLRGVGPQVASLGTVVALLAGAVVREAPRLALIERSRETAIHAGGLGVFLVTFAIGIALIRWVVRTVRAA